MRVKRNKTTKLHLQCDDEDGEDEFSIQYTNRGEPFREGVEVSLGNRESDEYLTVMLECSEARRLRDTLISLYPLDEGKSAIPKSGHFGDKGTPKKGPFWDAVRTS